ncbi:MAG: TetR/AcrR family transcriptional regulator [Clostridia bacterium]|jgi:AcrR family transcriptional regulator|nr:TetR/AcrR family transcriptional regulator [Clostridia bacterium]
MNKRDIILQTSLKLFNEYGFHGTPTSKIAKEAGVSNGSLFNYFPTKVELINTLYLEIKTDLSAYIKKNYNEELDFKEKIKQVWVGLVLWGIENPDKFKFKESFSHSTYIDAMMLEKIEETFKFAYEVFLEGFNENYFIDADKRLISEWIYNSSKTCIKYVTQNDLKGPNKEKAIEDSYKILINGICK